MSEVTGLYDVTRDVITPDFDGPDSGPEPIPARVDQARPDQTRPLELSHLKDLWVFPFFFRVRSTEDGVIDV